CVHGGSPGWVQRLFDLAAALQVAEAHALATPLASALGARPALGGHPRSGPRPHPHSVLAVIGAPVAPRGQAPAALRGPGLAAALGAFAHGPFQAQGSDEGWTAELPFGPRASRLTLTTAQRHEVLGHGLRVRLRLPVGGPETAA